MIGLSAGPFDVPRRPCHPGAAVFLKSLTMRGFKSFADATVLEVEPGVTVIVGPNGSGKSNVVDALAWVLGTASPRRVRGGSMSDVIFAGSPGRKPLGKAKVEIVIDNSQGQLGDAAMGTGGSAQQFSEVRVSREIFADGTGRYAINGQEVRALDVQELLSDTGLGRELHTIVGQGQLDAILNAKPEERRAFIEEAAGILKHRRRRERALRKLDQVDVHIDKLKSILRELRRQLRPLERQAEAADRHRALQEELTAVRLQIATADLFEARVRLEQDTEADQDSSSALAEAEAALKAQREQESSFESQLAELAPELERTQATYYRLTSLRERLQGSRDLVEARRKHLVEYVEEPLAGRPPEQLRAQADQLDEDLRGRDTSLEEQREQLTGAQAERRDAETAKRAHEARVAADARRRAELRERVVRWEGEISALRGALASAEAESGRLTSQLDGLGTRVTEAEADVATVQAELADLEEAEVDLVGALEAAEDQLAKVREEVDQLAERERELEKERSGQQARAEALRATLADTEGGAAALSTSDLPGLLGPVSKFLRAASGWEAAVAAALGPLGEAIVATTTENASGAVSWLRTEGLGSATLLPTGRELAPPLPIAGAKPIGSLLEPLDTAVAERARRALGRALARTYAVDDWATAATLAEKHPECTFVTADGDIAGVRGYVGGVATETSAIVTATAAADAEARAAALSEELAEVATALDEARSRADAARVELEQATAKVNESDAHMTGATERLARLGRELHALVSQREVVERQDAELSQVLQRDRDALDQLNARGPEVDDETLDEPGPDLEAEELELALEAAREAELHARLVVERAEEQRRHLAEQAEQLRQEAVRVEQALADAARRREVRRRSIAVCGDLLVFADVALEAADRSIAAAAERREEVQAQVTERREGLGRVRARLDELGDAVQAAQQRQHEAQLRRQELVHRVEELEGRVAEQFQVDPSTLRPEQDEDGNPVLLTDDDRAELGQREDVLVRKIGLLGRVNPLALEEFKALEQRHTFLTEQLEDLRTSKRDLLKVVEEVDGRIVRIFEDAFNDVQREFEQTFATVFPGGKGRLVLTEPDDLLTTGIEVEAQPPGKRVTRLSLLSGGERSLTVLAFVFAIFRARPSPFYVLDEVDAALDDVNLQRLLRVIEGLRGQAQIIMVTHMKRSMEIADLMYGVTMGKDAVTRVVAERMGANAADAQDAPAPEPAPV